MAQELRSSARSTRRRSLDGRELVAIFVGGSVGAIARAGLTEALPHRADQWPWATLAVNLVGAFALGYLVTRLQERLALSVYRRPLLGTGLCGALTTFSTMTVELLQMFDHGDWALAGAYTAASIGGGLGAVFLATQLVRRARFRP